MANFSNKVFSSSVNLEGIFIFTKISFISLFLILPVKAEQIQAFKFTDEELKTLKVRKVRGADNKTIYTIGSNKNGNYLKAIANNSASGLGKEIKINLNSTPIINITWKVEKNLDGIKENTKKGHDFSGRVFVIKKTGATPLSNRAVNYVFSSNNSVGSNWPSPYTKKSIDNVLSTTQENMNEWVTVKANVKKDFKKFHDLDVNEIDGIAIMTDTDNSKMTAITYYQNIYFSAE